MRPAVSVVMKGVMAVPSLIITVARTLLPSAVKVTVPDWLARRRYLGNAGR